jgi:hypothetical protein
MRRATFGPTAPDVAELRRIGIDAWLEEQLDPAAVPDDAMDRALAAYPLLGMSTAELRAVRTSARPRCTSSAAPPSPARCGATGSSTR